jgi:hypothetical protein
VINFIKNKQLQPVLDEVNISLPEHRCYVGGNKAIKDGLNRCDMRLLNDETRSVKFAVLSFHLPEF